MAEEKLYRQAAGKIQKGEREMETREEWKDICVEDRGDAIGWAAVFIWGALILLAEITSFAESFGWWDGWGVFFVGAGTVVLLGTAIRSLVPEYWRQGLEWGWICGFVMLGIGLGDIAVWVWPALLTAIGITILYRVFVTGR
jgi:hypothetical protein